MGALARRSRWIVAVATIISLFASQAPPAGATPPAKPAFQTWGASGAVRSELIIGSTLFIGGSFTSMVSPDGATTVGRSHLAAIDLTTGDLLPWNPSTNGSVLAIETDGTNLYIGGSFGSVNSTTRKHLAALDTSGALLAWNPKTDATVDALHVLGTTVYIGGAFATLSGTARAHLGAVSTSGELLPWDPQADGRVNAITSVSSGDIVVGGDFSEVGGQGVDNIDALDPLTGESQSWSYPSSQSVEDLITGPDDNVYGAVTGAGGKVRSWTSDGDLRWTVYTDGDVNAVAYYGGQVVAGGHWVYMMDGTVYLPRMAAFDAATGDPDLSWKPKPSKQVWSLAAEGATLAAGGVFTRVSGGAHKRLVVYEAS